jgi:hypothetical protein
MEGKEAVLVPDVIQKPGEINKVKYNFPAEL